MSIIHSLATDMLGDVAAPLPDINLGDHSLRLGIEASSGTREMIVRFRGAAFGYFEFAVRTFETAGIDIIIEMDGVEVVNQNGTARPWTIVGGPADSQVIQNSSIVGLRYGWWNEWTNDSLGLGQGPGNYVGETYDWRWTQISGEVAQQLSNAPDSTWVSILNGTVSFWRWDGGNPPAFTSVFRVDIRDGTATIVATGTFTIERFVIP